MHYLPSGYFLSRRLQATQPQELLARRLENATKRDLTLFLEEMGLQAELTIMRLEFHKLIHETPIHGSGKNVMMVRDRPILINIRIAMFRHLMFMIPRYPAVFGQQIRLKYQEEVS